MNRINFKWESEQIELLKKLFAKTDTGKIAIKLNKSFTAVKNKASRLGLKKANYFWTAEQEQFLNDNWEKLTARQIGKEINKTIEGVREKHKIRI